jgi:uncharacterized membrane protein
LRVEEVQEMTTDPIGPEQTPPGPEPVEVPTPESVVEIPAGISAPQPTEEATENDRLMAALSYASQVIVPVVVPAIVLLSEENKQRRFQKYHAVQSLGFLVAAVIYEILAAILFVGLSIVTLGCLSCILWILFLLPVVPAVYYAYQAYQGRYFTIPFVTQFMADNKWIEVSGK